MSPSIIRTATNAAYEAAKELGKASVLSDVPHHRDACLDKAEDELRLALRLITEAREPKAATVHPIMAGVLRDFGLPVSAPSNVVKLESAA